MTDLRYLQQTDPLKNGSVQIDLYRSPANLIEDASSLEAAMIIALGTDARAGDDDVLPDPDSTNRRGWWGDLDAEEIWGGWPVGCKLWLLKRAKIVGENAAEGSTVTRAESYTRDALSPFVDARVATDYAVRAERTDRGRIDIRTVLLRGREPEVALRYSELWDELGVR